MIQEMKNNALTKAKSRKGFTLAELLIVVAIIAILIAIAIPLFAGQLNNAKRATDDANFRSAKAVAVALELDRANGTTPLPTAGETFDADRGEFTATAADAYVAQTDGGTAGTTSARTAGEVITLTGGTGTNTYDVEWS